jgi:hypothetical protein
MTTKKATTTELQSTEWNKKKRVPKDALLLFLLPCYFSAIVADSGRSADDPPAITLY